MNKKSLSLAVITMLLLLLTVYSATALTITSNPVTTATAGQTYEYQVLTTPTENVSITLQQNPTGMTMNNGLISWIPTIAQAGLNQISVRAQDTQNVSNYKEQNYTINVQIRTPQIETTPTALHLGSTTQERGVITFTTWQIKNTGSYTITNLELEPLSVHSRYELALNPGTTTIEPGQTITVQAQAFVPESQNSGTNRIGTIKIKGTSNEQPISITKDINMEVFNGLTIERIDVRVDGKRERMDGPGTIGRTAKLGDTIEFTVYFRNELLDTTDNEMRDVYLEIISYDLEQADGLETSLTRLRAGRSEDLTLTFNIDPEDVYPSDAPFDIDVKITGTTKDGIKHGETWSLRLDMDSETYDLHIISATMTENVCIGSNLNINLQVRNIGAEDLETAMIRYYIADLAITEWTRDIDVEEGETRNFAKTINIPNTAKPGDYYIVDVKAYPRRTSSTVTSEKSLYFKLQDCKTTPTTPTTPTDNDSIDVITKPGQVIVPGIPVAQSEGKKTLFDSEIYVVILAGIVILLLISIIILLIRITK